MKKREMGWHILFYNLRRNIIYDKKDAKENLFFYFFKLEFMSLRTELSVGKSYLNITNSIRPVGSHPRPPSQSTIKNL